MVDKQSTRRNKCYISGKYSTLYFSKYQVNTYDTIVINIFPCIMHYSGFGFVWLKLVWLTLLNDTDWWKPWVITRDLTCWCWHDRSHSRRWRGKPCWRVSPHTHKVRILQQRTSEPILFSRMFTWIYSWLTVGVVSPEEI